MRYLIALLVAISVLAETSCCDHRKACGKVTTKVWSHVTGACYVIAQNTSLPSETVYIVCDTMDRMDSFITACAGRRITYKELTHEEASSPRT